MCVFFLKKMFQPLGYNIIEWDLKKFVCLIEMVGRMVPCGNRVIILEIVVLLLMHPRRLIDEQYIEEQIN